MYRAPSCSTSSSANAITELTAPTTAGMGQSTPRKRTLNGMR